MASEIMEANSSDDLRKVREFVKGLPVNDYAKCSELDEPIERIADLGDDEIPIDRACLNLSTGDMVIDWLKTCTKWDQPQDKFFPVKKVRNEKKRVKQIKKLMKKYSDSLLFTADYSNDLYDRPITNRELLIALMNASSDTFIY